MILNDQAEVVLGLRWRKNTVGATVHLCRWCIEALGDFTRIIGDLSRKIDVLLTFAQVELVARLGLKPPASCVMWHHYG